MNPFNADADLPADVRAALAFLAGEDDKQAALPADLPADDVPHAELPADVRAAIASVAAGEQPDGDEDTPPDLHCPLRWPPPPLPPRILLGPLHRGAAGASEDADSHADDDRPLAGPGSLAEAGYETPAKSAPARDGLTSSDEKFADETARGWCPSETDSDVVSDSDSDDETGGTAATDDDWYPLLMTTHCPKATRARNANNSQYRCLSKDGRPETNVRLCSNDEWQCSPSKHRKSTCTITWRAGTTGPKRKYSVPKTRALKAMKLMSPSSISEAMEDKSCNCRRRCNEHLTVATVTAARLTVAQCKSEADSGGLLTGVLRAHMGKYVVGDREVCQRSFCAVYGASGNKVKKCMQIAKAPVTAQYPTERLSPLSRDAVQYTLCVSFWTEFFDKYCQRPNDGLRLFPVAKTMRCIHSDHFVEWCAKQNITGQDVPSLTTLKRARGDASFADVQRLKHHNHCRCTTCGNLKAELLAAGNDTEEYARVRQLMRVHDDSVTAWRRIEEGLKSQSMTNPHEVIVIFHDGTQALGTPRCTNRPPKNLTKTRFNWIPWLAQDVGRDRYEYIYMPKDRWACDANYLITMLQAIVHRAKSDYTHPQYRARKIVFVADNASENKNNELLAWATDLVLTGLFDEVEFLFGEVGHTHNGVDACHKIHNADVGKVMSGDIGHFVHNYNVAYVKNIPQASILTQVYDFKRYYAPHMRKISGFTKTETDPAIVRGWKVMRSATNDVEIRWKLDPGQDPFWKGMDGTATGAGFRIYATHPANFPEPVAPQEEILKPEYLKQLKTTHMKEVMHAQELLPCVKWNYNGAKNAGVVPMEPTEDEIPKGEWGKLHLVGAIEGKQGRMRTVDSIFGGKTRNTMFDPAIGINNEHEVAKNLNFHFCSDAALRDSRRLPYVRYSTQNAKQSKLYDHPNNVHHREVAKKRQELLNADDTSSDDEDEPEVEASNNDDQSHAGGAGGDAAGVAASDAEPVGGGSWYTEHGDEYFEVDFKHCKPKHFFVTKVSFPNGQDGINLGKVVKIVDGPEKLFEAGMYQCTKPQNTRECITASWYPKRGKDKLEVIPNWQVITYFESLTTKNMMKKPVRDKLNDIEDIRWFEAPAPGDYAD